ncbi:MAG: hypothetical protein ACREEE_17135 [Dongiaceae bacterium]
MYRNNSKPSRARIPTAVRRARTFLLPFGMLLAAGPMFGIAPGAAQAAPPPEPFKVANIHFETNASACDMGIQIIFDTDGVFDGFVKSPKGQMIYQFRTKAGMRSIGGLTEGFLEGVEPQITELLDAPLGCVEEDVDETIALGDLFAAFPEGAYTLKGKRPGARFEDQAILSYAIPAGPEITAPLGTTGVNDTLPLTISWNAVTGPILPDLGPVTIVGYHVIVVETGAEALPQLDIDVPADAFSLVVPAAYLLPNKLYAFEILATEASGNQTISEGFFCTAGFPVMDCVAP